MPISVSASTTSGSFANTLDTNLFAKTPYSGTIYIKSYIQEDIQIQNQFKTKIISDPISIKEVIAKNYVDQLFNYAIILKNTAHVDFNDNNLDKFRFLKNKQLSSNGATCYIKI